MAVLDKIAILMTCHNRRAMTMASLNALFQQKDRLDRTLDVYLVDDGSTDGTSEAICQTYPRVKVIQGTGNLYWNGGMRLAFARASKAEYDYYLWLNDDVILYPDALKKLRQTYDKVSSQGDRFSIICGSTCDEKTGLITSGGFDFVGTRLFFRFNFVEPTEQVQLCDTVSGNCVLIPKAVFQKIGNLHSSYTHYLGDIDYGLRVQKQGGKTWITPAFIGTCSCDLKGGNQDSDLKNFAELWCQLFHPKGLNCGKYLHQRLLPIPEWTVFLKYHQKYLWWIPWILTYRKLVVLVGTRLHIFCWFFIQETIFKLFSFDER